MEEDLVVISRSIVIPRNAKKSTSFNKKKIHLLPWDLARLRFGYLQRGLLYSKPYPKIDTLLSKLQTSLSLALDRFHPLAGRLVKVHNNDDTDTVSFHINPDGSGVEFVHAAARNIEVSDILRLSSSSSFVPSAFTSFFPATGVKNCDGVSRSLLMVQVTEMKDGIFIGFGYNSTVADGESIWRFLNSWSEICSKGGGGLGSEARLQLKGCVFDEIDYPIRIPDPEAKAVSYAGSTGLQELMFHVTKENVLRLEAKANDEKVSSFQAVLGHVWCSLAKHGGMSREEETHCRLPIDMRRRLSPPLGEECFGNVSQTGIARVTVGELMEHGVGWAAGKIDEMERSQTYENARAFAERWVGDVKIPVSVGGRDLVVTSSHRFDVYGNDFGWGKPVAARAGPPYVNGRLVVFQGVEEGSLDFQACLLPQVMEKLSDDVEFKEYVSIVL
ncbi:protein ENHANCED PSEUDOMONAS SUSCEPTIBILITY 1 [Raphanus sativus]|uniref:Protein ENHANCED PSEUDOMONAS SUSCEPTIBILITY 1 n=1 Tax=Raphanus sativus TaxID=3726 RepID=A0A6J0JJB3_RAPSA|nr:protein ENHANCED PSEUDOMONAS SUSCEPTIBILITY 1 [Raphanus sativus]